MSGWRKTSAGRIRGLAWLIFGLLLVSACRPPWVGPSDDGNVTSVKAKAETAAVPSAGDAADDPAIWVHPGDSSNSTVIGTDYRGGLGVYDLAGRQIQFLDAEPMGNVDLRDGFSLRGEATSLVVASGRRSDSLRVYTVDVPTRRLTKAGQPVRTGVAVEGLCLYTSPVSGSVYAFAMDEEGLVEQWELFDQGGKVRGRLVRGPWNVGDEVEHCVADDELKHLYIGEEQRGVWRYGAEPGDSVSRRTLIDSARKGRLVPDIEGLAIAYGAAGNGLLFASSQGDSSFVIYRREPPNPFVGKFRVRGNGIDGCEDTDGIEVTTKPVGSSFPEGLFVCQDGSNPGARQNFKLVPLDSIIESTGQ